ncbi:MAG: hypothetical protein U0Q47_00740 [Mycobacterium sp.]
MTRASPDHGSDASVFGIAPMFTWRAVRPAFFRGETLRTVIRVLIY